uniref:Predicted protein n=1 Tax=Hordeum vulgare subsp. vulgare TaxID=112509 RepID=F2DY34_HORVV|nr:predicted protein [Hordeum vulgare subsp. vulgare]
MNLDSSDSLMIMAKTAKYDLDNIMLKNVAENNLYALYELRHVIVEGNCYEQASGAAPNGLQLVLKSTFDELEEKHDTVVMQNLGYFQLKSNPGIWNLDLAEGKSSEIYEFVDKSFHTVVIDSFNGKLVKLNVNKKEGKGGEKLYEDVKKSGGLWDSISHMWGNKKKSDNETIHIFSVASGHLYERFMSIMMMSVVKHTKSKVKFWIIENFVSPEFKLFVPQLAKSHNFEVQFVAYNWPRWLNAQKEKQRKIWAYKILFLDVLFPLDINRIIFVDADQTVRGDIKELWDLDIGGAPYAYVPFCPADSRPETKGFRFWDSGFWHDHLGGKPYHISALYRVDLDTFRRSRSGDILRSTYNNLSRDKNSLANLDQDLPNYLQHMVPIFSLPQEWLWCETWCSDELKKTAKTIDLCNNPLTKAPKLDNALRIVSEWKDYDQYVADFREKSKI